MQATGRRQLGLPRSARPGPMRCLRRRRGDRIAASRVPSLNSVVVPNVIGMSFDEARRVLHGARLVPVGSDPDGPSLFVLGLSGAVVVNQDPRAGLDAVRRDRRSRSGSVAGADRQVSVNHAARCPTRSQFGAYPRIRWTRPSADQGATPPGWAVASGAYATHSAGGDLSARDRTNWHPGYPACHGILVSRRLRSRCSCGISP